MDGDQPYIVIEKERSGSLGPFFVGALVGAGLALLFAPKSGEETQEEIKEQALRLKSAAQDRIQDVQRDLEDRLDQARAGVEARIDSVKDAVDAGRRAALEARDDLEGKLERSKAAYRAGVAAAKEAAAEQLEAEAAAEEVAEA